MENLHILINFTTIITEHYYLASRKIQRGVFFLLNHPPLRETHFFPRDMVLPSAKICFFLWISSLKWRKLIIFGEKRKKLAIWCQMGEGMFFFKFYTPENTTGTTNSWLFRVFFVFFSKKKNCKKIYDGS